MTLLYKFGKSECSIVSGDLEVGPGGECNGGRPENETSARMLNIIKRHLTQVRKQMFQRNPNP